MTSQTPETPSGTWALICERLANRRGAVWPQIMTSAPPRPAGSRPSELGLPIAVNSLRLVPKMEISERGKAGEIAGSREALTMPPTTGIGTACCARKPAVIIRASAPTSSALFTGRSPFWLTDRHLCAIDSWRRFSRRLHNIITGAAGRGAYSPSPKDPALNGSSTLISRPQKSTPMPLSECQEVTPPLSSCFPQSWLQLSSWCP